MTWKLKKKRRRTMISLVILVSLTRVIEGNKDLQIPRSNNTAACPTEGYN